MSQSAQSPKLVLACLGVLGAMLTALVGLTTIGGIVVAIGVWKGGVDYRMSTLENTSKDQITALTANTDRQVKAVSDASKEMVSAVKESTSKQIDEIKTSTAQRIDNWSTWRNNVDVANAQRDEILVQLAGMQNPPIVTVPARLQTATRPPRH